MKQRRLSLSESSFYGNTTFKKNSICLSRRGHRLAWSRIPSLLKLHYIISLRYWPGALAVVGSNPTGPITFYKPSYVYLSNMYQVHDFLAWKEKTYYSFYLRNSKLKASNRFG